jgi:hypothetical protein
VDAGSYEHLYLLVLNLARASSEDACDMLGYTVEVQEGGTPQPPTRMQETTNFLAPEVEAIIDFDQYCELYYCEGDYYYYYDDCDPDIYYCDDYYYENERRQGERKLKILPALFTGISLLVVMIRPDRLSPKEPP